MDLMYIVVGFVIILTIAMIAVFLLKYKTAGPDEALIVTGSFLGSRNVHTGESNNKIKIIRGGGTFIFPVFQQSRPLSLVSSKIEVATLEVYTEQGIPVMAEGTAIIKIGGSIREIAIAAEQFLGKTKNDRENEAKEVLEGHLCSILGSMTVEEIYRNRDKFSQEVQRVASQDLAKMGLVIVSFTIRDVRDKNGYLDSLGKPRLAQVKRDAEIATAEAEKEARIKKADADREAKKAEFERATEIAEAEKFTGLKIEEFRREQDIARARADQAYQLETARSQQEIVEQEMQVKIIERQKQIELEEKEILRRERQYDYEVKKRADADRYAAEQSAAADKAKQIAQADAGKYRIELLSRAESERIRWDGLAKAEAQRALGEAEAEIICLKGVAEAEVQEKTAQVIEQFGQAAILDMIVKMLPEYAKQIAAPLGNIEKITVVDIGGGDPNGGANKVTGYVTDLMETLKESLKESSGIDMKELIENLSGESNIRKSVDALKEEIGDEILETEETEETDQESDQDADKEAEKAEE